MSRFVLYSVQKVISAQVKKNHKNVDFWEWKQKGKVVWVAVARGYR